jgi:hypothetical protein
MHREAPRAAEAACEMMGAALAAWVPRCGEGERGGLRGGDDGGEALRAVLPAGKIFGRVGGLRAGDQAGLW